MSSNSTAKPFIIQANRILSARQHNEHGEMKNDYILATLQQHQRNERKLWGKNAPNHFENLLVHRRDGFHCAVFGGEYSFRLVCISEMAARFHQVKIQWSRSAALIET